MDGENSIEMASVSRRYAEFSDNVHTNNLNDMIVKFDANLDDTGANVC